MIDGRYDSASSYSTLLSPVSTIRVVLKDPVHVSKVKLYNAFAFTSNLGYVLWRNVADARRLTPCRVELRSEEQHNAAVAPALNCGNGRVEAGESCDDGIQLVLSPLTAFRKFPFW